MIKFTNTREIQEIEADLKSYIYEAIEVEKLGQKVEFKRNLEPIPEELENKFKEDPILKSAFETLTPGRQRRYVLYFSAPKQSKTRESKIKKTLKRFLMENGKGLNDKYKSMKK